MEYKWNGAKIYDAISQLVLAQCQIQYDAKYDIDYPPIMIYSLPTPFYLDRPINHKEMKETIIKGLQHLESTGVGFIAMPCNSYTCPHRFAINIHYIDEGEGTPLVLF